MNSIHNWINTGLIAVVLVLGLVGGNSQPEKAVGGSTSDSWTVGRDLTVDTTSLYVDSTNNRVGIGTTTPKTLVEIVESNATSTVYVRNASTTATTGGRIILEDTDGAGCSQITILNGTVIAATVTCP